MSTNVPRGYQPTSSTRRQRHLGRVARGLALPARASGRYALVFTTENDTQVWISSFRRGVWWPALDTAGIPRIVTIKDLRHTCASLMHAAGRSAKEVKEQLGHSTIAMTLDTYTHLFDEGRDEAAEAMGERFRQALPQD